MEIAFYLCFALQFALGVFTSRDTADQRAAIIAWRVAAVLAVASLGLWFLAPFALPPPGVVFTLSGICLAWSFVILPLDKHVTTCQTCARRAWWAPILTSRCPHCGHILYRPWP